MAEALFTVEILTPIQVEYNLGWKPLATWEWQEAERNVFLGEKYHYNHVYFECENYMYYQLPEALAILHFVRAKNPVYQVRLSPL